MSRSILSVLVAAVLPLGRHPELAAFAATGFPSPTFRPMWRARHHGPVLVYGPRAGNPHSDFGRRGACRADVPARAPACGAS